MKKNKKKYSHMCYKKLTRKDSFSTLLMSVSTVVLTAKSEPHGGVVRCCKEHSRHKRKAIPEKNQWACLYCYQLESSAMGLLEEKQ